MRQDWEIERLEMDGDDPLYELLWVRIKRIDNNRSWIIGGVYHPPAPIYSTEEFLEHLEQSVMGLMINFPSHTIILAGDFNKLTDTDICARTGLFSIVKNSNTRK